MKLIHTFNEEQFSKNEINKMGVRRAIRAVIFDDDNNIAILHVQRDKYYSLPGGAVEKDETFQSGFVRECWEETGCRVEIVKEVGETFEIRGQNDRINNSVCYIAKIISEKGPLNLDEDELDENIKLIWVDIDKAIELTSNYSNKVSLYNKYTRQRDIIFLKEVKSNL